MKIGIITSRGGHLTQALNALEAFKNHDCFLIIQEFPSVENLNPTQVSKLYYLKVFSKYGRGIRISRNFHLWPAMYFTLFQNSFKIVKIFLMEKPDVVFSTGAEIAVIGFYIAKFLFKTKLIFLESLTRIKDISHTGKIVMPITDLFLVQWEDLTKKYKKATFLGSLI
jgi:UDP-N-acetylglucosamine:LPS N-acetylglucosamine transferase